MDFEELYDEEESLEFEEDEDEAEVNEEESAFLTEVNLDEEADLDSQLLDEGHDDLGLAGVPEHGLTFEDWLEPQADEELSDPIEEPEGAVAGIDIEEDPFIALSGTHEVEPFTGYEEFYEVHGSPIEDMDLWDMQDDPCSCAVATTNMMFRSLGLDPGEDVIADVFEEMGIYDPAWGTDPYLIDDVINELAEHADLDVQATEISGFDEEDLSELLDAGVRPLVGVDSGELYDDDYVPPDTGHAVQVTGLIESPEGDFVVINDPGFPEGAGQTIPLNRFMAAADDFGFSAVSLTVA
jgi:hypothetical protein